MSDDVPEATDLWWPQLPAVSDPDGEVAADFRETRRQIGYVPNVMLALANATGPFLAMRALYRSVMTEPAALLLGLGRHQVNAGQALSLCLSSILVRVLAHLSADDALQSVGKESPHSQ